MHASLLGRGMGEKMSDVSDVGKYFTFGFALMYPTPSHLLHIVTVTYVLYTTIYNIGFRNNVAIIID